MTKEFCDYCKKGIINRERIIINFTGSTKETGLIYDNTLLCEKCYSKIHQQINKILFNGSIMKGRQLSKEKR